MVDMNQIDMCHTVYISQFLASACRFKYSALYALYNGTCSPPTKEPLMRYMGDWYVAWQSCVNR